MEKGVETTKSTRFEGFWFEGKKHGPCVVDLKKKTQGFLLQVYELGTLKQETLSDTQPTVAPPVELTILSDETEEELSKTEILDEEEIGFTKLLAEAIISKKPQTWTNLSETFLAFYLRKLEFEDLLSKVSRLEEIKKSTKMKAPLEEKLIDFESAQEKEEMINLLTKYSVKTDFTDETAKEIVKMKFMVLTTQIKKELLEISNDVEEMNKLGDIEVIKSKEKDLEKRYKTTKQEFEEECLKLPKSDSYRIDTSITAYEDLFKLTLTFISKLLKTKKKYFKSTQGAISKEVLDSINNLFEKNYITFDSIVTGSQFSKIKIDLEALNRRCYQFDVATREKKI